MHFLLIVLSSVMVTMMGVTGHVFRVGDCPVVEVEKNFDIDRFSGMWYVIQKFRTASHCVAENITKNQDSYYIYETLEPVGISIIQKGKVHFKAGEPSAVMKVSYPITVHLGDQDYRVVMTDYDSYAAVWSCQRIPYVGHRQSAQIMARVPTLDIEIIRKIRRRLESFGINEHYFSIIDHSNCKWNLDGVRIKGHNDTMEGDLSLKVGPVKVNHSPSEK